MRTKYLCAILLSLLASAAWAQAADIPLPNDDETLEVFLQRVLEKSVSDEVLEEQKKSPAGTANVSNFASRVNDSLQNFLPFLQGAIDAVTTADDGKSLTVRFNPVRAATYGELGLSATATEPQPSEALLKLLPDDSRPGQKEVILKQLDDFADLTVVASYNYVRKLETGHLTGDRRRLFGRSYGRSPRLYGEVFSSFVHEVFQPVGDGPNQLSLDDVAELGRFQERFEEGQALEDRKALALRSVLGDDFPRFVELMLKQRSVWLGSAGTIAERAKLFSKLVANQPQITLTAAYRERDPLVGPDEEWTINLTAEMPSQPNINELIRSFRRTNDWQGALDDLKKREDELKAGTQWTVNANYKARGHHRVTYQPTTAGAAAINIDQNGSYETCGKLQYSRRATWQPRAADGNVVYPMLHLSGEYINVSNDPNRRDRWLWTLTYDVPFGNGTSVPISVVYSNHGEFKTEPDQRLSAHFGINLNALFDRLRPGATP